MRATRFLSLLSFAALATLTAWSGLEPLSTGVLAQAPAPTLRSGRRPASSR